MKWVVGHYYYYCSTRGIVLVLVLQGEGPDLFKALIIDQECFSPPRGHLTISGNIFGDHSLGGGSCTCH